MTDRLPIGFDCDEKCKIDIFGVDLEGFHIRDLARLEWSTTESDI